MYNPSPRATLHRYEVKAPGCNQMMFFSAPSVARMTPMLGVPDGGTLVTLHARGPIAPTVPRQTTGDGTRRGRSQQRSSDRVGGGALGLGGRSGQPSPSRSPTRWDRARFLRLSDKGKVPVKKVAAQGTWAYVGTHAHVCPFNVYLAVFVVVELRALHSFSSNLELTSY